MSKRQFDIDLAQGQFRESEFAKLLAFGKIEHKRDYEAARTGNVYVEFSQAPPWRRLPDGTEVWQPSGLAVTEAQAWSFEVAPDVHITVLTSHLRYHAGLAFHAGKVRVCRKRGDVPTKGVLVRMVDLLKPMGENVQLLGRGVSTRPS